MKKFILVFALILAAFSATARVSDYDNYSKKECRVVGRKLIRYYNTVTLPGYRVVLTQSRAVYVCLSNAGPDFDITRQEYDNYKKAEAEYKRIQAQIKRTQTQVAKTVDLAAVLTKK